MTPEIAAILLCFTGGYIIVNHVWNFFRDRRRPGCLPFSIPLNSSNTKTGEHYRRVLGVGPDAGPETLRTAYLSQIEKYNSIKVAHLGPEFVHMSTERTQEVVAAYEFLTRSGS